MTLVPTVLQTPSSPLYRRRRRESTTFNYAKAGRPGTPPIQTVLAPTTRPAPRERSNTCVRVRVDKSGTCSVEPSASRSFEQNDRTAGLRHLDDSRGDLRTGVDQRKVLGQGEDRRAKLRNEDDQKSSLNHDEDQQILNSKSRQILKNGQKDDIGDSQYYVASTDCSKNSNFEYSTPHNPANTKISSFDAKFKYVDSEDRTDSDDRADSEDCADYFNFSIDSDNGLKSAGNCVESTNIVPQDSTDTNFVPKGNTDTSSVKSNKNDSVLTTVPQSTTTVQNLPQDSEPTTDSAEELADIVVIPNHFQRSNTLSVQHDHFVPHAIAEVPEVVPNVRYRNSVANIHCNGYLKLLDNKLNHTINHQNSADTVLLQRPFTTVGHYSNQKVNSIGPRAKTLSTTGRSSTLTANSTTTGKLPYTNRQRSSIAISGNTVPKPGCTVPNLVAIARSTVSKSIDNSVPNLTEIAHRSVPRLTRESTVPTTVVRVPNYKYSNVLNPQISDSTNALANNIPQAYSNTSTQVLGGTLSYSNLNQYDRPFNTALQCTCNIELSTRSSFSALQSSNPGANLNPTRTVFGSRGSCSALPSCYTVGNNAEYTVPIQNIGTGDQARACLASTRLLNQNQTAIQGQNTVSSSGATVSTTLDGTVTPNSNTVPNFSVSPTPYAISPYSTVQLNQYSAVPITPNPTVPISPNTVLPISPYPTVATPSYSALTTPNPNKSLRLNDSTFSSRAPSSMSAFTRTIHPTATPPPCPVHSQSQRRFSMSAQQLGQARFRHKIGSYWRSFELYTDIPKTAELTRTGSIIRRRLAMLESFDAIKEEKSNGDVRFDVNDGDGNPHKRSAAQVKSIRRRQSGYGITITSDSTAKMRCRQRKQLFQQRNQCCDFSLVLGLLGLILVVIDTEITALNIVDKTDYPSIALRSLALVSTVLLIGTIINYHRIEVKIALIDSGADDWRVAVSTDRLIKLSIEILICIVCPFPGSGVVNWTYVREDHHVSSVPVPMDVIMSIPMYLRVYLFCRFMVLHSRQFQDAATRSIAALNRISMDFWFVVKTMMSDHPLRVLIMFTMIYWLCASWAFTQCERWDRPFEHYYMNSLWFVIVTFLSIGYGDVVPRTYVGRALAVLTGIVGAGVSSALIAVISRKLELSRAEKHVNNFMADSKLTNQRKNAAASVLQHTWFIHRYQRSSNKGDDLRLRQHQRKFLNAINEFRRIKWDQRKLQERGNSLLDIGKLHNEMHETLWEMHRTQDQFITQIDLLTQRIGDLQNVIMTQQTPQNGTLSPQNTVNYVSPPGSAYNNYPPNSNHPPFHQPKLASPNPKRYSVQATAITMPEHVLHVQKSSDNTPTGNGGLVHQHAIEKRGTLSQTSNDLEPDETDISASSPLITRQNF